MTNIETKRKFHKIWPAIVVMGSFGIGAGMNAIPAIAQDSAPATQDSSQDTAGQRTDGQ